MSNKDSNVKYNVIIIWDKWIDKITSTDYTAPNTKTTLVHDSLDMFSLYEYKACL